MVGKKSGSGKSGKKKTVSAKASSTRRAAPAKEVVRKRAIVKPKSATGALTQAEFVESFQNYCNIEKKKEAKELLEGFSELVRDLLKKGYKIPLPGIGKMQVRKTKARMGINPKTREPIKISAKKKVKFTVAKTLKEAVL